MANVHRTSGVKAALERLSAAQLAEALGITSEAVYQWHKVPLTRVHDVERVTGVPLHVLRPDFFGDPRRRGRGELRA